MIDSMQPIAEKAKMNRYTIHESQYRLSTSFAYPTSKPCTAKLTEVVFNVEGIQNHFVWGEEGRACLSSPCLCSQLGLR